MKGINFSITETSETDAFGVMLDILKYIYMEADEWDFKIEIQKENGTYNIWIGDKEE